MTANAFAATLNAGNEVVIPAPYRTIYIDVATLFEGIHAKVTCGPEQEFKNTQQQLEATIAHQKKWVMLNSPPHPTGMIYSRAEHCALGEVLREFFHGWRLSDEICERLRELNLIRPGECRNYLVIRVALRGNQMMSFRGVGGRTGWRWDREWRQIVAAA